MNTQSVLVNGYQLYLARRGSGQPTVVFEAGAGETSATWHPLIERLPQHIPVCAYDHFGLGQSDSCSGPRRLPSMVDDLFHLLHTLCVTPPYILVGHSLGALIVYHYAQYYPDDVAGLVLLDAPHPRQIPSLGGALAPYLDDPIAQELYSAITVNDPSTHPERLDFGASLACVEHGPPLADLPVTVICRGRSIRSDIPDLSIGLATDLDAIWRELQHDVARRTTHGRFVVAEKAAITSTKTRQNWSHRRSPICL